MADGHVGMYKVLGLAFCFCVSDVWDKLTVKYLPLGVMVGSRLVWSTTPLSGRREKSGVRSFPLAPLDNDLWP